MLKEEKKIKPRIDADRNFSGITGGSWDLKNLLNDSY